MLPSTHVEQASTEVDQYERKSGLFLSSKDTPQIRQVRYGTLRENQKEILRKVEDQNDRQIDVFYDPAGNHGKSWLTLHLWERRDCFVVPRSDATAGKISAFICSGYDGEKYIIVDLPRASKPSRELYEILEDTKDGLVFDHRYSARTRNIRGTKLIVFTNSKLDTKLLSYDRWRFHNVTDVGHSDQEISPNGLGGTPRAPLNPPCEKDKTRGNSPIVTLSELLPL